MFTDADGQVYHLTVEGNSVKDSARIPPDVSSNFLYNAMIWFQNYGKVKEYVFRFIISDVHKMKSDVGISLQQEIEKRFPLL